MRQVDPSAPAELAPKPPFVEGADTNALDPELLAIPAPPQAQRLTALTVMAATVVAILALVLSLRLELTYALSQPTAQDLGEATQLSAPSVPSNRYVRLRGVPAVARAVHFKRWLSSGYLVFPLSGQPNVFVQVSERAGESFVRSEYKGRLVTFGDMGRRYGSLARGMNQKAGLTVSDDTLLLLADEAPSDYRWAWVVAALGALFVLLDAYLIVRWFKPLKWAQVPPTPNA